MLLFKAAFLIKFHPQIIDSLFAIKIFLLFFVNSMVGFKPAIPGMAAIVISDILIFLFSKSKILINLILLFLNFFFTLFKTVKSLIRNMFGLNSIICLQISL